jgi:4-hydroxyphenylpyruvate dioxygenase-like putative hemolysin
MLELYRLDHIAQLVPSVDEQAEQMEGLFGYRRMRSWSSKEAGCKGVRLAVPGSWNQHWVLLEPLGDDSLFAKRLEERKGRGGLDYVAFEVSDIARCEAELKERGIEIQAGEPGRWLEASLTPPKAGEGVLFRLVGRGEHSMLGDDLQDWPKEVSESGAPSLGITQIDHVCQAFKDRDELARWYNDLAGFVEVWRTPDDEHPDMADLVMNIPGTSICWEIIMPRGEDSFIERFLERNGPQVHHVTFEVADGDAALRAGEHHEIETFDSNDGTTDGAAWQDTFIHPKLTGGVLVQLFWEERPGVGVRSDKIPPQR